MQIKFTSRRDANTFVQNAGLADWTWGGNASAEGFADWLYATRNEADTADCQAELAGYLESVGENPGDYL